ncbi:type III secretion system chaperone family protein [Pelagerythrobacter rhizovicinus]|uniref:YbjN domain-containing protein n=1 Tax=Pelagerythrobacter rhizovicinus TaxID=2268576 RepID=A0A4Q2KN99_9SPHN|nr:YbjN domain-containing protein [Pelagerythrobacter rhizovicinus]RXZ65907.1 hypothetical protein ETX26_04060 [Pelagerythrobacter rhizovicinus]
MRKVHFLAAIALASAIAAPAPVQAQGYSAERLVRSVDLDDLRVVVTSLGHTVREERTFGDVSLSATDAEGTNYIVIGTACGANGSARCQGVMMQVRFDPDETVNAESLARANLSQAAVNTWRDPANGTIGVTRYVVLDHGITMANLRENVNVLLSLTPSVVDALLGE